MQNITPIPIRNLRLRARIFHPRNRMPLQQLLPIWRRGRLNRIPNRDPTTDKTHKPQYRRPRRMRQQIHQDAAGAVGMVALCKCADGAEDDGDGAEEDVDSVHDDFIVPENNAETAEERGAECGVPLVEFGGDGAGGGEGGDFAAQELGKDEGADYGDAVEGGHPHHGTDFALADSISCWDVGDVLVETAGGEGEEAESD